MIDFPERDGWGKCLRTRRDDLLWSRRATQDKDKTLRNRCCSSITSQSVPGQERDTDPWKETKR